jgi:hypothetical protein
MEKMLLPVELLLRWLLWYDLGQKPSQKEKHLFVLGQVATLTALFRVEDT